MRKETMQWMTGSVTSELANTLGLHYGYVVTESGGLSGPYFHVEELTVALKRSQELEMCDADQAAMLEQQAREAGLSANMAAIRDAITAYELPKGFETNYTFEVCQGLDAMIPHGHVTKKGAQGCSMTIWTLENGFNLFHRIFSKDSDTTVHDTIALAKQMIAAGVPCTGAELDQRVEELTPEQREQYESGRSRFGGLGMMIIEIRTQG